MKIEGRVNQSTTTRPTGALSGEENGTTSTATDICLHEIDTPNCFGRPTQQRTPYPPQRLCVTERQAALPTAQTDSNSRFGYDRENDGELVVAVAYAFLCFKDRRFQLQSRDVRFSNFGWSQEPICVLASLQMSETSSDFQLSGFPPRHRAHGATRKRGGRASSSSSDTGGFGLHFRGAAERVRSAFLRKNQRRKNDHRLVCIGTA